MDVDIVSGYLGAGKTSCLQGLIAADPEPAKLAVLVNEFGELGIDGLLLEGAGDVVEMASGCICCTLRLDFRAQIQEIAARWRPRRLLVEPTGVATTAQVQRALAHPDLATLIGGVRVIVLVDALSFSERLRESPGFFTSQISRAHVILLNKTDLVPEARVKALVPVLEGMNPDAWVVPTVRGRLPAGVALPAARPLGEPEDAQVLDDLVSSSFVISASVARAKAEALFSNLAEGVYGSVERAKAVLQTTEGWLRLDLASGHLSQEPWGRAPEGRLTVIGRQLDEARLSAAVTALAGAGEAGPPAGHVHGIEHEAGKR